MSKDEKALTIEAVNKSGYPFQRRIAHEIASAGWRVDFEYDTRFFADMYGEERTKIDILATAGVHYPTTPEVMSVVECKRREPAYHKWLFFSRKGDLLTKQEILPMAPVVWCKPGPVGQDGIVYSHSAVVQPERFDRTNNTATRYDCYLELKAKAGKGKQRTSATETEDAFKTSAAEIEDAFRQVAVGLRGAMRDLYLDRVSGTGKRRDQVPSRTVLLPVVVSSAPISSCSFADAGVDLKRGILDVDSTKLANQRWLLCSYVLPYELRFSDRPESSELCIWVVGAENCREFFRLVKEDASQWNEDKH
jgi:hypothetical protein